jgi:hypothetical protein
MRLVRRHGLPALVAAAYEFNVAVIMDVLREAAIKPELLPAEIAAIGLATVRQRLTGPLAQFALAIAGPDPDAPPEPAPTTGERMTPEEVFTHLFEIATGWLGWTPEEAWNATIPEIIAAHRGRTDMIMDVLKAVFGTSETAEPTPETYTPERLAEIEANGFDPAFDRAGLNALKGKE